jgi:hypothetical protein
MLRDAGTDKRGCNSRTWASARNLANPLLRRDLRHRSGTIRLVWTSHGRENQIGSHYGCPAILLEIEGGEGREDNDHTISSALYSPRCTTIGNP